jgi:hypothetical protein
MYFCWDMLVNVVCSVVQFELGILFTIHRAYFPVAQTSDLEILFLCFSQVC